MLKFAIIGFGGLAKCHFRNVPEICKAHPDAKLVALCDIDPKSFETQTQLNISTNEVELNFEGLNIYYSPEELLEKEELDFVITAIPTFEHARIAIMALNKGIHVFSEKPMAISVEEGKAMRDAAKANNRTLMIGQCVRYFPEYALIKELSESGKYGKILRAHFFRMSTFPKWCWNEWYSKDEMSGGAILDLHVHDVDFINYLFGRPKAVTTRTTSFEHKDDSVFTSYDYGDTVVTSVADWSLPESFTFIAEFFVHFEKAVIEFKNNVLTLYPTEGEKETINLEFKDGYVLEVIDFIQCIKEGRWSTINNPDTALQSLEMALAEKTSAAEKRTVEL